MQGRWTKKQKNTKHVYRNMYISISQDGAAAPGAARRGAARGGAAWGGAQDADEAGAAPRGRRARGAAAARRGGDDTYNARTP